MKSFKLFNNLTFLFTLLVILAGSLVRMTGSGMGCPDWPKCFGYIIPPYKIEMLDWKPNHEYKENQMILLNSQFYTVKSDFVSNHQFDLNHWILFTEHDYNTFNPKHTYIEYFNRLVGALLGVFAFIALILSLFLKQRKLIILSFITVFLIGFEAWLGALVVESVLSPVKITTHLLVAFIILGTAMLGNRIGYKKIETENSKIKLGLILLISAISLQVISGTFVREAVDTFLKLGIDRSIVYKYIFNNTSRHILTAVFLIISSGYLIFQLQKNIILDKGLIFSQYILIGLLIAGSTSGVFLSAAGLPHLFQPIHLLIATFIYSIAIYIFTKIKFKKS